MDNRLGLTWIESAPLVGAPDEIKQKITSYLSFKDYLIFSAASRVLKEFADSNGDYWSAQFSRRFGFQCNKMNFLKNISEFSPLFKPVPNYLKIYTLVMRRLFPLLDFHLVFPTKVSEMPIKQMVVINSDSSENSTLYLIDDSETIKAIDLIKFQEDPVSCNSKDFFSLPPSEKPSCIAALGNFLIIGTESGTVLIINTDAKEKGVECSFILERNPKILSIEGSKLGNKLGLILVVHYPATNNTKSLFYKINAERFAEGAKMVKVEPKSLASVPRFGGDLLVFAPQASGGFAVYNLDIDYPDDLEVKPVINFGSPSIIQSVLVLGQHLIYATNDNRIGWVEKKLIECDSFDTNWIDNFFYFQIKEITPVNEVGFCVHGKNGERVVALRTLANTYRLGYRLVSGMENPVWLENGTVLFHKSLSDKANGMFVVDFSRDISTEMVALFGSRSKLKKK